MLKMQKIVLKKKITFDVMAENWLLYKKLTVKVSTYYNYRYLVNTYLIQKFEKYTAKDFINYNINEVIYELLEHLSPKTVKSIALILTSILNYSEEKYNFKFRLDSIAIPKLKYQDFKILTFNEQLKLEKICLQKFDPMYMGILLSLYTGIRIGELCALTWGNIDLKNRKIYITKTLQRIYIQKNKTKILIDSPKSNTSIRKIPMNDKIYNILKKIKNKNEDKDFFLTGKRVFIEPRRYQYIFNKTLKEAGIKNYNFHTLRHTFATNCIKVGMDPKSLSEILGHSNVSITLNRYVHSSDKIKKKFLQKL